MTDMELESEAQLRNVLPPLIWWHQAQSYAFGTSVVDTHSQIDVGGIHLLRFNISSKRRLLNSEYSLVRDSTYVLNIIGIINTSLHRHLHPNPNPNRCRWNPIDMSRFLSIGISIWEHNNRYSPLAGAVDAVDAVDAGTLGLFDIRSPSNRVMLTPYRNAQQPSFHNHDSYQCRLHLASYSNQHPERIIAHKCQSSPCTLLNLLTTCVYMGIITLTCESPAHIRLLSPRPHSVPFGRSHRSLYVCVCDWFSWYFVVLVRDFFVVWVSISLP